MAGKWKQELLFVKRDDKGVIIAIREDTPEGYVYHQELSISNLQAEELVKNRDRRFWPIGD